MMSGKSCLIVDAKEQRLKVVKSSDMSEQDHLCLLYTYSDKELERFGVPVDRSQNWDDDDYIYCDDCRDFFKTSCLRHPLYWVSSMRSDELCGTEDRARKSIPEFLCVKESVIPGAGLGVFTKADVPIGFVFGPYQVQGIMIDDEKKAKLEGYIWEVKSGDGRTSTYIDGSDERYSNWMRFINCSRTREEQNLMAFQCNGSIYYRVCVPIEAERELLVWYGHKFGEEIGVVHSVPKRKMQNPFILR